MTGNLGDEAQVKEHHKEIDAAYALELEDLYAVMLTPRGRRFVNRLIVFSEVLGELFSPNGSIQSRNLGRRDVGILLMQQLESRCPELYQKMRSEYLNEKEA